MSEDSGPEKALELDPTDAALQRARHWIAVERWEQAEKELLSALAQDPDAPWLHYELARAYTLSKRKPQAVESLREALRCDPSFAPALILLGALHNELGNYAQAEKDLLEALRLDPTSAIAYECYGDLMRVTGHHEKAVRLYRQGLALAPDDAGLHSKMSLLHRELGDEHARRGLRLEPEATLSHAAMAHRLYRRGRPFAAKRHLREALRVDPNDRDLEEFWLELDRCTRIVYVPMYYWSLLVDRVPGRQLGVWGAMVLLAVGANALGLDSAALGVVFGLYILICVYTWIAGPLVAGWIKLFPPKL